MMRNSRSNTPHQKFMVFLIRLFYLPAPFLLIELNRGNDYGPGEYNDEGWDAPRDFTRGRGEEEVAISEVVEGEVTIMVLILMINMTEDIIKKHHPCNKEAVLSCSTLLHKASKQAL